MGFRDRPAQVNIKVANVFEFEHLAARASLALHMDEVRVFDVVKNECGPGILLHCAHLDVAHLEPFTCRMKNPYAGMGPNMVW